MVATTRQEYIGIDELATKLGLEGERFNTFRDRVYRRKVSGQVKIFGRWSLAYTFITI